MSLSHTWQTQSAKVSSDRLTGILQTHKSCYMQGGGGGGVSDLGKRRAVILDGKIHQLIDGLLTHEGQQGSLTLLLLL